MIGRPVRDAFRHWDSGGYVVALAAYIAGVVLVLVLVLDETW